MKIVFVGIMEEEKAVFIVRNKTMEEERTVYIVFVGIVEKELSDL